MNIEDLKRGSDLLQELEGAKNVIVNVSGFHSKVSDNNHCGSITLELSNFDNCSHISVPKEVMLKIIETIGDYYTSRINVIQEDINRM